MGSILSRWFSKRLKMRTSVTDSTIVSETSGRLGKSVMHCLDLQRNIGDAIVEDWSPIAHEHGFDLGHCDRACRFVSAAASSTDTKPGTAFNETAAKSDESCLTDESPQSLCHIQTSQNTQLLTTDLEASISDAFTCDGCVNSNACTDNLSSSSGTLLSPNSSPVEHSEYCGLTAGEIALIENYIEVYLNRACPTTYYDFCLVTCDIDYEEATVFRSKFCMEYNLMGCMLSDDIPNLGGDIFEQYETMMNRSTKVFFYLTENYKKDSVHLRVQNGAVYQQLWKQMCKDKDKCVPVFPNGCHRLGLALSGISGLDPTHTEQMHRRVLATFTERVRKVRMLKEEVAKKRRSALYKELCKCVAQYYKERKDSHHHKALSMNTLLALNEERVGKQELEIPPFFNIEEVLTPLYVEEEVKDIIYKLVTERCENSHVYDGMDSSDIQPSNNKCNGVHISESSNIHVGPRIEVNVHVTRTREGDSCCTTNSEDDDVETKIM